MVYKVMLYCTCTVLFMLIHPCSVLDDDDSESLYLAVPGQINPLHGEVSYKLYCTSKPHFFLLKGETR